MKTKVSKWGNSLAVRIPAAMADATHISDGSFVEMEVADGQLTVHAVDDVPTLEELLASVTPGETHGEVDWGPRVGNEVW
ncbi:MAG: AbrB/MazE/SpoVT family DNA-binding domain-containing protein [Dehalococcoidia bacterium]